MTTLEYQLKKLPKYCIVKIGSKNCFLYCYYNNDSTIESLNNISDKLLGHIDKLILKHALKGNEKQQHAYQTKKYHFKPLIKRKVKEVYKSDFEDNTYIIIIKGSETGNYWCIDEYAYKNKLFIASKDRHYPKERLEVKKLNYGY